MTLKYYISKNYIWTSAIFVYIHKYGFTVVKEFPSHILMLCLSLEKFVSKTNDADSLHERVIMFANKNKLNDIVEFY